MFIENNYFSDESFHESCSKFNHVPADWNPPSAGLLEDLHLVEAAPEEERAAHHQQQVAQDGPHESALRHDQLAVPIGVRVC